MHSKCSAEKQSRLYTSVLFVFETCGPFFIEIWFLLFTFNHAEAKFVCVPYASRLLWLPPQLFHGSRCRVVNQNEIWGHESVKTAHFFLLRFLLDTVSKVFPHIHYIDGWVKSKYSILFFQLRSIINCMWMYSKLEVGMHRVRESRKSKNKIASWIRLRKKS